MNAQIPRAQILQKQQGQQDYLKNIWAIFKRKWWLIFLVLAIVEGLTFRYSKKPAGPYQATAVVRPVRMISGGGGSSIFNSLMGGSSYMDMETEMDIIRGKRVAEKVIENLGLEKLYSERESPAPSPAQTPPTESDMRSLVSQIQSRLEVDWKQSETKRRLRLIEITARSYSAQEAMELANGVAEAYIQIYNESKQQTWEALAKLMDSELKKLGDELQESRRRLYEASKEKGVTPSSILGVRAYMPSDYPQNIAGLRSEIMRKEIELEVLRKDFPDADPKVASLKNQIAKTRQRLEEEEKKAREKYDEQFDLTTAEAEVQFKQQLYSMLMSTQQNLKAQYVMQGQSPEITERALKPLYPSAPSRRSGLSLGAAVGLFLGIGLSIFLEYLDTSMRTNADVVKAVGLPVLGRIPRLRGFRKKPRSDMLTTYNGARSNRKKWLRKFYKESYRMLQLEVMAALNETENDGKKQGLTLLISSSEPEEGKSVVAANLAVSISQTGKKVLLVDADCRHPIQYELLGLDTEPGLTDILTERLTWPEVAKKTPIGGMSVIASGQEDGQIEASAALSSSRMDELISLWQKEFDVIIFDSPAAVLASESIAVGSKVDGIVLVLKVGATKRDVLLQAKELMEYSGANILGIALNFVAPGRREHKSYFSR
jgi:capsular exopolysaccharide synthesis family protein